MATQIHPVQLQYSHTIGRAEFSGPGFRVPVGIARGDGDRLYVLSRSYEGRPDGKRVTICTVGEEYISEFGRGIRPEEADGVAPDGYFMWPTAIALDKAGHVYVADEWTHRISIFAGDGGWIGKWGTPGAGEGELNRPSGMAFDRDENLYVVDSLNSRVQKFTKDGTFILTWGKAGSGEGEFNMPWGIAIDREGDVYVTDWRNDRVQKFTPEGRFLAQPFALEGEAFRVPDALRSQLRFGLLPVAATRRRRRNASAGAGDDGRDDRSPVHDALLPSGQLHTHAPFRRFAIAPVPAPVQGLAMLQSLQ